MSPNDSSTGNGTTGTTLKAGAGDLMRGVGNGHTPEPIRRDEVSFVLDAYTSFDPTTAVPSRLHI
jgi:hypothetical protein